MVITECVREKEKEEGRRQTLETFIFNKLLLPVDDGENAIFVSYGDVAGLEPPVGRDRVLRRGGIIQIPPNSNNQ